MAELTQRQEQVREAYVRLNSESDVARELGIDYKAVVCHLWSAYRKTNELHTSVIPANFSAKKVSVFHKPDGEIIHQWTKADANVFDHEAYLRFIKDRVPLKATVSTAPKRVQKNKLLEIPIYDAHIGMLAWEKETGANYDTKIARALQVGAFKILREEFGEVGEIVIYLGGDNQTIDNRSGTTEKSGHHVDTDSRYHKMVWCTYETNHTCIDIALQMAKKVTVIVLSGNHDWHSAIHLACALHAHYRNDKRVKVDISPEEHKFFSWGRNVFMASHGDQNERNLATYFLNQIIQRGYDRPINKMIRLGHLHKRGKITPPGLVEHDGVIIERFPTLAAQEAYSVTAGYSSVRATSAVLWDDKYGRKGGREVSLGEIMDRIKL